MRQNRRQRGEKTFWVNFSLMLFFFLCIGMLNLDVRAPRIASIECWNCNLLLNWINTYNDKRPNESMTCWPLHEHKLSEMIQINYACLNGSFATKPSFYLLQYSLFFKQFSAIFKRYLWKTFELNVARSVCTHDTFTFGSDIRTIRFLKRNCDQPIQRTQMTGTRIFIYSSNKINLYKKPT